MVTSVMWFRRDLRLADNPALLAACAADEVVPLFVVDPVLWRASGRTRRVYLLRSLAALDDSLGGALVVRKGDPVKVVPQVAREVGALTVHHAADYGPYGSRRDEAVREALLADDVETQPLGSPYAVAPGRIRNGSGDPYKVYSAYQRAWAEHGWRGPVDAPTGVTWADLKSHQWPDASLPDGMEIVEAGEKAARAAWSAFRDHRLSDYDDARNIPGGDGASRMSTYLKWGEIHPRTILADLAAKRSASADTYRKEIAWREFYADVLWHRPDSAREDYNKAFSAMTYDDPGDGFEAWKEGRTGFPVVDAGMRQLAATGYMHNRVRMIVASFLVKDLHVWWRHGARHFMDLLADGDLASNQHGWQWMAGSGTDAAPYFRIFNPTSQGSKFDPDGTYVRRWVPELADVAAKEIHQPQDVDGYPAPILDHKEERAESLRRYEKVKGNRT
jgi:deoxyribodipyrimidine photo-lyase